MPEQAWSNKRERQFVVAAARILVIRPRPPVCSPSRARSSRLAVAQC
jgi:hypothetical protein